MINRMIGLTRYLIGIAVAAILLGATTLLVFGAIEMVTVVIELIQTFEFNAKVAKQLLVSCIEVVDIFLLATVMYIIALGLYELFIDNSPIVPEWLEIRNLDDLKEKLVGVLVVVLAVGFLALFVSWDGQSNLLISGGAVALVIASLTFFLRQQAQRHVSEQQIAAEKETKEHA